MKLKIAFISLGLFLSNGILAQGDLYYGQSNWMRMNYHSSWRGTSTLVDTFALENSIYQVNRNSVHTRKKGKHEFRNDLTTFDSKGRVISRVTMFDTGSKKKLIQSVNRVFNQRGLVASLSYNLNSQYSYSQFLSYNDSGKEISAIYFDNKDRFSGMTLTSYDMNGRKSIVTSKSRKGTIKHEYRYFYFPDGKLKQIVLTGRKGKVIRVTDYTCDDAGNLAKKMKDTAKVCIVKSYLPDGGIITTTQSFDYRGEPYKTVEVANAQKQVLKYDVFYGIKEQLRYSYVYGYNEGKLVRYEFMNYSSKKHPFSRLTEYDLSGRIIKDESVEVLSREKTKTRSNVYQYDEKNMILSEKVYEDGKLKNESSYSYYYY